MNTEELNEILECLVGERTLFHYYPDRYAVYLLARHLRGQGDSSIRDLRSGNHAKLLNRPILQNLIKRLGDGRLSSDDLNALWPNDSNAYVLTLGTWGQKNQYRWAQTSRPGSNLVLQLNLSEQWAQKIQRVLDEKINEYIGMFHPLSKKRGATLAWARIDLDMRSGVSLIEEIQSDLIKELENMIIWAKYAINRDETTVELWRRNRTTCSKTLLEVAEGLLDEIKTIWHEAMLTAAIWFLFEELGMKQVYFHSFDTGCVLKNLRRYKPPKSLYTQVPNKFCFEQTTHGPEFVMNDKHARRRLKKAKDPSWFVKAA